MFSSKMACTCRTTVRITGGEGCKGGSGEGCEGEEGKEGVGKRGGEREEEREGGRGERVEGVEGEEEGEDEEGRVHGIYGLRERGVRQWCIITTAVNHTPC